MSRHKLMPLYLFLTTKLVFQGHCREVKNASIGFREVLPKELFYVLLWDFFKYDYFVNNIFDLCKP